MLSVVIPAYNEESMIPKTAGTISGILEKENIDYELLFVCDGSVDRTWDEIYNAHKKNNHVKGIRFSRNFGKESAMFAGLAASEGDCVVVIDCDLQHPPEKIIEMYRLWEEGYEIVEGVKRSRGEESGAHSLAAKTFYHMISNATGIDMSHASDFKLLDRKVVNVLLNMHEKNAFFRALSSWVGFRSTQVEYDVREREAGKSKWNTRSLVKYALTNITSFTSTPMQIVTGLGLVFFVLSLICFIIAICQVATGTALEGFKSVMILQCFTSSIIMISIGIVGYYIAKIYDEVKGRPRYIIAETIGKKLEENDEKDKRIAH
ncbi:MAG: glycosyltransferase family 2 protein [Eubacterium sp.]|nr:glycosyltransferase family 2 protein [Eubacterium sp.]